MTTVEIFGIIIFSLTIEKEPNNKNNRILWGTLPISVSVVGLIRGIFFKILPDSEITKGMTTRNIYRERQRKIKKGKRK